MTSCICVWLNFNVAWICFRFFCFFFLLAHIRKSVFVVCLCAYWAYLLGIFTFQLWFFSVCSCGDRVLRLSQTNKKTLRNFWNSLCWWDVDSLEVIKNHKRSHWAMVAVTDFWRTVWAGICLQHQDLHQHLGFGSFLYNY